jgi:hypothetical protein
MAHQGYGQQVAEGSKSVLAAVGQVRTAVEAAREAAKGGWVESRSHLGRRGVAGTAGEHQLGGRAGRGRLGGNQVASGILGEMG